MRRLTLVLMLLLLGGCSSPHQVAPPPAPAPGAVPGAAPGGGAGSLPSPAPAPATQASLRCGGTPLAGSDAASGPLSGAALPGPTGGLQRLHAGPDWLLGTTYDRLFSSSDGGRTWQEIPAPQTPFGLIDAARLPGGALLAAAVDGQLYRSDNEGGNWQPVAAVPRAMGITVDGQTVFVAGRQVPADGSPLPAIYRSDDGGKSWSVSGQGFWPGRANAVARDPADPNTLYAGIGDYDLAQRGGGLFKSTDGGKTWRQSSQGLPGWPNAVFAAGGHVYARTNEGLYRSDDAAATWQPVAGQWWYAGTAGVTAFDGQVGGLDVQALAFDPGSGRLVAATEGGVFTRTAGGEWEQGGAGLPTLRLKFALPYATAGRALFRAGRFTGALPAPGLALAVSPTNPDHLWALPGYESSDGGRTWQPLPPGPKVGEPVLAVSDTVLLARGEQAYLLRSGDGGRTWEPAGEVVSTGLKRGPGSSVWAISDHGLYRSEDGGRNWQWSGAGLPSLLVWGIVPDPVDPQQAVALTDHGLACTADGGATWQVAAAPVAPPYQADTRISASPGGRLFFAQDKGGVWALSGESWRRLDLPAPEGLQDLAAPADDQVAVSEFWDTRHVRLGAPLPAVGRLAAQPAPAPALAARWFAPAGGGALIGMPLLYSNDASVALAGSTQGNLYLTRDGGRTWAPAGKLVQGIPQLSDPTLPNGTYTPLGGGPSLSTRDGGRTWTAISLSGLGAAEGVVINPDPRDPQVLVASFSNPLIMGGSSGVLRSTDGGLSWQPVYSPPRAPNQPLRRIGRLLRDPANPDRLWASGDLIVVSQDGGATWHEAGEGAIFGIDNAGTLYGSVGGKPVRSDDSGKSWQPIPLPEGVDPAGLLLRPDAAHPGRLFLLNARRGLWYTADGGQSWSDLAAGIGEQSVRAVEPAGAGGWYVQTMPMLLFRLELP